MQAEQSAKIKKLKIWENYVKGQEVAASKGSGSSIDKKYQKEEHKVIVTEVMGGGKFYYQGFADPEVAIIQKQLSSLTILETHVGFQPRKGFLVLAQFSADKSWNQAMVASKTNDSTGYGTTTTSFRAREIIKLGLLSVTSIANPVSIKNSIDKTVHGLVEELEKKSRSVKALHDVYPVIIYVK